MTAYVIADIDVQDPSRYDTYKRLAQEAIARHGGRYLVRGGKTRKLEGDWSPQRVVVLEFSDMEAASRFYNSPEYRAARDARTGIATMNMIVAEGL